MNQFLTNNSFSGQESDGIEYYTIPSFERTGLVRHGFSCRRGGFSEGKFGTLNLSNLTEDDPELVLKNRRKFCAAVGIAPECLVSAQQVHGDSIYKVTLKDKGRGAFERDTVIPATDALMTNEKGLALLIFFADCVPVLFLDPLKKVIAVAHAGWRGTVAKIAAKTVQAMEKNYGTKAQNILVGIGPSIGSCHYQVDEPVIAQVEKAFPEADSLLERREDGHAFLNLWESNRRQLLGVGLADKNIVIAGLCTSCSSEKFFSHRAGMRGRQAAVLMLK